MKESLGFVCSGVEALVLSHRNGMPPGGFLCHGWASVVLFCVCFGNFVSVTWDWILRIYVFC